jgi:protein-S-isoprenylcysteine O-methyltransferase Ste14
MVKLGNFLFHYRNFLFPIFYAALFIPSEQIMPPNAAVLSGLLLIFLGIVIRCITIGLVYIVRGGRNRTIYANELVVDGIYEICRNPMYLGNLLLLLGFGVLSNSFIFMVLFFPLFCLFYYAIIKAEEYFLGNQFGEQYSSYKQRTWALIPDLKQVGKAFRGRSLDYRKIIKKEYNSLFLYFTGIILLFIYNQLISWETFIISQVFITVIYLIIKVLKKKKKL